MLHSSGCGKNGRTKLWVVERSFLVFKLHLSPIHWILGIILDFSNIVRMIIGSE